MSGNLFERGTTISVVTVVASVLAALVLFVAPASAEATKPWWQLTTTAEPAVLSPGATGTVRLVAVDVGDAAVNGEAQQVVISGKLPEHVVATAISATSGPYETESEYGEVSCTLATLTCTYNETLPDFQRITVVISVKVEAGATSGESEARISGGGAPSLAAKRRLSVGTEQTAFGPEQFSMVPEEVGGAADTQAGSHPFQLTTTLALNRTSDHFHQPVTASGVREMPKDLHFDLPAGLVGNPTPFAQCPDAAFIERKPPYKISNSCPPNTVVGVSLVTVLSPNGEYTTTPTPLFNLKPSPGEPARFGFPVLGNPVILDTEVERHGEYRVHVNVNDITQLYSLWNRTRSSGASRETLVTKRHAAGAACTARSWNRAGVRARAARSRF